MKTDTARTVQEKSNLTMKEAAEANALLVYEKKKLLKSGKRNWQD